MKKLLILLLLIVLLPIRSSAITVTIGAQTFLSGTYNYGGATATLRVYSSKSFIALDGTIVPFGEVGGTGFFKSVPCTVSSNTLSCPSFTLPSTDDAIDDQTARYTFQLVDYKNVKRDILYANLRLPASLGANTTFPQIVVANHSTVPWRDTSTYTRDETNTQIRLAIGAGGTPFANPTSQIGLTAINGSASTAMRSDAAPALRQDISPTWTAPHTFTSGNLITTSPLIQGTVSAGSGLTMPTFSMGNLKITSLGQATATGDAVAGGRLVSAGNGLTGGGDLTADRTISLGTPSAISVSSTNSVSSGTHTHAVTSSANPGAAASLLASDSSGFLQLTRLGIGGAPSQPLEVTGNVFINNATANLFLKDTSTGFQSSSSTVITPQNNNVLRSTSYTSGLVGWNISATGSAEFDNVDVRGAIHAGILVYNALQSTAGTLGVFKSACKLKNDATVGAIPTYGTTTISIDCVDPDGLLHAASQLFVVNDVLRLKDGLVGDTWFKVTAASDQTSFWRYTASIQAGSNNATYRAGLGVADYGPTGSGFIIQTADQTNSPYLQMATHAATFSSGDASGSLVRTPQLRIGNLNGSYGYATDIYGFGAGQYGTASKDWLTVDQTNGIRIGNNTTQLAQWDTSGVITVGQVASGQSNVRISSGAVDLRNNTTNRIHLASDGSGFLANSSISWDTSGNLTVTGNATFAGFAITPTYINSGTTYVASGFDVPAGAHAWFGKAGAGQSGQSGFDFRDASNRVLQGLVGNGSNYPFLGIYDGAHYRVVVGGLNTAFEADGATASMGMKIWNSSGSKLIEFSDVQNIISGWTISNTSISSGGITLTSGTTASLSIGTTPPSSSTTGTGIWIDKNGMFGLAANVLQAKFDATNGKITAGAGNVVLDSNGMSILATTGKVDRNSIKFYSGSTPLASLYSTTADGRTNLRSEPVNGINNKLRLIADADATPGISFVEIVTSVAGVVNESIILQGGGGIQITGSGVQFGAPTGGVKGSGTINVAGDIYKNNVAYTSPDFVFEKYATGSIVKFANNEGASNYRGLMPLSDLKSYVTRNYHLPRFGPTAGLGLFSGGDALLATVEELHLYIFQLEERIKALEAKVK